MREPSDKRKRTLQLHDRAILFNVNVNKCCPTRYSDDPSKVVWGQLVRAADGTVNNLIEADDAVSDPDFLNKMGTALKEVKESRVELVKLRFNKLDNHQETMSLGLETEATELSAIFAAIIRNMKTRLEREKDERKRRREKERKPRKKPRRKSK